QGFHFAQLDPIGNLITRAFELMQTLRKKGTNSEHLTYMMKSLAVERTLSMEYDQQRDMPLRDLVYSFCVGLESIVE
ncbi:hypothetical protein PFISCL1PPCAC_11089, partial [Pristionchus fissidentatus]